MVRDKEYGGRLEAGQSTKRSFADMMPGSTFSLSPTSNVNKEIAYTRTKHKRQAKDINKLLRKHEKDFLKKNRRTDGHHEYSLRLMEETCKKRINEQICWGFEAKQRALEADQSDEEEAAPLKRGGGTTLSRSSRQSDVGGGKDDAKNGKGKGEKQLGLPGLNQSHNTKIEDLLKVRQTLEKKAKGL